MSVFVYTIDMYSCLPLDNHLELYQKQLHFKDSLYIFPSVNRSVKKSKTFCKFYLNIFHVCQFIIARLFFKNTDTIFKMEDSLSKFDCLSF